jgi:hypothetical protein
MAPHELRLERPYQGNVWAPCGSMVFARTLPAKPKRLRTVPKIGVPRQVKLARGTVARQVGNQAQES